MKKETEQEEKEKTETAEKKAEEEETPTEEKKEELEEEEAETEEIKPLREKEEEEFVEERIYTIPLGKAWIVPSRRRAPKAIRIIRDFVKRHMKFEAVSEEEEEEERKLIISNEVNEAVWRRGIGKPPRKIRVRAAKDKDGNITVFLAEGD